jgi:hypothetical protein
MLDDREQHREGNVERGEETGSVGPGQELDRFDVAIAITSIHPDAGSRVVVIVIAVMAILCARLSSRLLNIVDRHLIRMPMFALIAQLVRHQDLSSQAMRVGGRFVFQRKGQVEGGEGDHIRRIEEREVCFVRVVDYEPETRTCP